MYQNQVCYCPTKKSAAICRVKNLNIMANPLKSQKTKGKTTVPMFTTLKWKIRILILLVRPVFGCITAAARQGVNALRGSCRCNISKPCSRPPNNTGLMRVPLRRCWIWLNLAWLTWRVKLLPLRVVRRWFLMLPVRALAGLSTPPRTNTANLNKAVP